MWLATIINPKWWFTKLEHPPVPLTPLPLQITWLKEAWPSWSKIELLLLLRFSGSFINYILLYFQSMTFLNSVSLWFFFRCFESALGRFRGSLSCKAAFLSLQFSVSFSCILRFSLSQILLLFGWSWSNTPKQILFVCSRKGTQAVIFLSSCLLNSSPVLFMSRILTSLYSRWLLTPSEASLQPQLSAHVTQALSVFSEAPFSPWLWNHIETVEASSPRWIYSTLVRSSEHVECVSIRLYYIMSSLAYLAIKACYEGFYKNRSYKAN